MPTNKSILILSFLLFNITFKYLPDQVPCLKLPSSLDPLCIPSSFRLACRWYRSSNRSNGRQPFSLKSGSGGEPNIPAIFGLSVKRPPNIKYSKHFSAQKFNHWSDAYGQTSGGGGEGGRGDRVPLTVKNLPKLGKSGKNQEKSGKNQRKSGKRGKIRKGKNPEGSIFLFAPPDR